MPRTDLPRWLRLGLTALALAAAVALPACSARTLGSPLQADPKRAIKIGHDGPREVLQKLGPPYRRTTDGQGRPVFVYVWADGNGGGQKWLVSFNESDVVYIVELAQ